MTMLPPYRIQMRRARRNAPGFVMLLVLALGAAPVTLLGEDFSSPHAYATLRLLVNEIGPRPMGSPAEQRALGFAAEQFAASGCDTAYVVPMYTPSGINTRSGIAVGVARGTTGRIIVIGGHIDSAGPDIPGANDNGSGAACVIELCRVLTPRDLQSTLVFCCFGGEEEGLYGSEHFVETFPLIDSVVLMLQLDMADGASHLELDPDGSHQQSAPHWLPEAALEIYERELGFSGLIYTTHSSTLNASGEGATGSDHMPFLRKGIPAVAFVSDFGYPIHTPLDNLARFDSSGLVRSGLLAQKLVERFDAGVPSRTTEQYYLVQFGTNLVFFNHPLLWVLLGIAAVTGVTALVVLLRNRDRTAGHPRLSGLKIALFVLLVQFCIWLPETVMGWLTGLRFPWVNNFPLYVMLGLLGGFLGVWGVLRWATRMRLHPDPAPFFVRFFIIMSLMLIALAYITPELAIYAGWALFFLSLAVLVRPLPVKALLLLASPVLPLMMIFPEALVMVQRGMSGSMMQGTMRDVLRDLLFVALFTGLSLPFAYGGAAVYRSASGDLFWLRRFRSFPVLVILVTAAVGLGAYLLTRPVYDNQWPPSLRIDQRFVYGADSSDVRLQGSEDLGGVLVRQAGADSVLEDGTMLFERRASAPSDEWLSIDVTNAVLPDRERPDSLVRIERVVDLYGALRPLSISLQYRSEGSFAASSAWSFGSRRRGEAESENLKTMSWYAFPEMPLRVPVSLRLARGQRVIESLTVTYDSLAADMTVTPALAMLRKRCTITRQDTLQVGDAG